MNKLERDALLADLATVNTMLASLPEEDLLGRMSFGARKAELERTLAALGQQSDTIATVALLFHGDPVVGSRAIDSEFAAKALERYQDIIAKRLATSETGGLAQRGPIPSRRAARLNITDVVHGSFGFILEEDAADSPQLFKSSLREATEDVTEMLVRFSGPRDEDYDTTIEDIDERLFNSVRQFIKVLHDDGATLRVVEGEQDQRFGRDAVDRAHRRVENTSIEDLPLPVEGILVGLLPMARRFELLSSEGAQVISGKVGPRLSRDYLERIENHQEMSGKQWLAILRKRTVNRPGRQPLVTYTLMDLREPGSPIDDLGSN